MKRSKRYAKLSAAKQRKHMEYRMVQEQRAILVFGLLVYWIGGIVGAVLLGFLFR